MLEKELKQELLLTYLKLPHLSTGDILRSLKINQNDELAIKLKEILASGKLVSDDILNSIVSEKIINDCRNGFILRWLSKNT